MVIKMKTKWIISVLLIATLVFSVTATAALSAPRTDNSRGNGNLEKIVIVHYKKGFGRPTCNNNGICEPELGEKRNCADCKNGEEPEPDTCYGLIGVKWKTLPTDLVINPDNPFGLTEAFVTSTVMTSAGTWDAATSEQLFSGYTIDYSADYDEFSWQTDGRNEIVFGTEDPGIIAVAMVWGYFRGRPSQRRIVEFDIKLNNYYTWGDATSDPSVMDIENIVTHELGHGLGLDDMYDTACSEVTMYGYSDNGETSKRTLEEPDITGLQELYGA